MTDDMADGFELIVQDVRLGADPSLPDGGKANGFGSLWEYEVGSLIFVISA
jgi:hypothetical protein